MRKQVCYERLAMFRRSCACLRTEGLQRLHRIYLLLTECANHRTPTAPSTLAHSTAAARCLCLCQVLIPQMNVAMHIDAYTSLSSLYRMSFIHHVSIQLHIINYASGFQCQRSVAFLVDQQSDKTLTWLFSQVSGENEGRDRINCTHRTNCNAEPQISK